MTRSLPRAGSSRATPSTLPSGRRQTTGHPFRWSWQGFLLSENFIFNPYSSLSQWHTGVQFIRAVAMLQHAGSNGQGLKFSLTTIGISRAKGYATAASSMGIWLTFARQSSLKKRRNAVAPVTPYLFPQFSTYSQDSLPPLTPSSLTYHRHDPPSDPRSAAPSDALAFLRSSATERRPLTATTQAIPADVTDAGRGFPSGFLLQGPFPQAETFPTSPCNLSNPKLPNSLSRRN